MSKVSYLQMLALGCLVGVVGLSNFIYLKDGINPFDAGNDAKNQIKEKSIPLTDKQVKKMYLDNKAEVSFLISDTTYYLVPASNFNLKR